MRSFYSTTGLKYFVERTTIGKNLPIYTEYRNGGNNCFTIIKRIAGDTQSLSSDLAQYFATSNLTEISNKPLNDQKKLELISKKWKIRADLGHIWVHGKHTGFVRKFLESKGF